MDHNSETEHQPPPTRGKRLIEELAALALLLAAAGVVLWIGWHAHVSPDWWRHLLRTHPTGIILHHSSSPERAEGQIVNAALIDRWHKHKGFRPFLRDGKVHFIGYHYVILRDGTIQPGRPEGARGSHCSRHNDQLGICLVGNFDSGSNPNGIHGAGVPSQAQLAALDGLLHRLIAKYGFTEKDIHRHSDYSNTACPGNRFPFEQVVKRACGAAQR